jgi:molybdopterin-guanine dinucleotide biosynthesis protein A
LIGVVLAGGAGSRLGGSKAALELGGRPLVSYPVDVLRTVCERVAIACKRETELPELAGVERWDEPDDPRHPAAGIAHSLERAGAAVLVCGADMPFVTESACALIAQELRPGMKAAVAFSEGRLQPLLGAYGPEALEVLRTAPDDEALTRTVESLMPVPVDMEPEIVFNVNTPDDLAEAERRLRRG